MIPRPWAESGTAERISDAFSRSEANAAIMKLGQIEESSSQIISTLFLY
jgi:hypothetical protein